jgi:hypothetical protein
VLIVVGIAAEPKPQLADPAKGAIVLALALALVSKPVGPARPEMLAAQRQEEVATAQVRARAQEPPSQPANVRRRGGGEADRIVNLERLAGRIVRDGVLEAEAKRHRGRGQIQT